MKLSIIIVNWNTRELTKQTLQTLFDTTRGMDLEVFVVDNASQDNSVEMIEKKFPHVQLIKNNDNLGVGKANNQALAMATGEYLMLLNSDVIVHNGAMQQLVKYLDTHKDVMMVGPKLLNEDGTFQHACRRSLPDPVKAFRYLFGIDRLSKKKKTYKRLHDDPNVTEPVEALSGAAMMFRREVYEKIGGLDDETFFMYGEDLDFCKRVKDSGWKTVYVHSAEITHLGGQSSKKRRTASIDNFYDAMWRYYQKHFANNSQIVKALVRLGIGMRHLQARIQNSIKPS